MKPRMEGAVATEDRLPLAEQLQAAIATQKESLYSLAKRAGVSYAVLHRFVAGKRSISLETADQLAKALGMTFSGDGRLVPTAPKSAQLPQSGRDLAARLLQRVFDGAMDQLVASALSLRDPTPDELARIEALLAETKPSDSLQPKTRGRKS